MTLFAADLEVLVPKGGIFQPRDTVTIPSAHHSRASRKCSTWENADLSITSLPSQMTASGPRGCEGPATTGAAAWIRSRRGPWPRLATEAQREGAGQKPQGWGGERSLACREGKSVPRVSAHPVRTKQCSLRGGNGPVSSTYQQAAVLSPWGMGPYQGPSVGP